MSFKVIKPGPLTTIQDAGRIGQSHLGLCQGGPMDFRSFAIANRLVGNPTNSAALEVTLGGLTLECLNPGTLAVTGAFCPLFINGKSKPLWQSHTLQSGDIIEVKFTSLGVRAYVAFAGGIKTESWFGSCATVVREQMGRALAATDQISVHNKSPSDAYAGQKIHFAQQPQLRQQAVLEFVAGYQWQQLATEEQKKFLSESYTVSAQADRMGVQLDGAAIQTGIEQIYSEGITTGSIQITGAGTPILLMRDAQTIGGYPKLGALTCESRDVLAQLRPGSTIQFKAISAEQSLMKLRAYRQDIEDIQVS